MDWKVTGRLLTVKGNSTESRLSREVATFIELKIS
jgi:hypothetical protein